MRIAEVKSKPNKEDVTRIIGDDKLSKSEKIRQLFNMGYETSQIAKALNISYNFAYNVLVNYINVNGIEVVKTERQTKKNVILEELKKGKSLIEVSKSLRVNYNQVWKIAHDAGLTNKKNNEKANK